VRGRLVRRASDGRLVMDGRLARKASDGRLQVAEGWRRRLVTEGW
jgi:hypothetical protein|tara:strand:+ start:377 stop:511 length:135 start_codon:yes stop_codon:yes gene_type:complete